MTHKTYVTFGQVHQHHINGKTFDKDCVAVVYSEGPEQGRALAFEAFNAEFCFEYPEAHFDPSIMRYFPRGYIHLNPPEDDNG